MPQLGCFVKRFYFVWCKIIRTLSLQERVGKEVSKAVPAWWAVSIARISVGSPTGWRMVGNVNPIASTKSRSKRRAIVYGFFVISIRRQFHRCPSWFVNQREKKCRWIVPIHATAVTCSEKKKWKARSISMPRLQQSLFIQFEKWQENIYYL